jgi:hypothetical protein
MLSQDPLPSRLRDDDHGDVHVFLRYAFTVTATGKDVAMNLHHYWKFRDGKVCFVRPRRIRHRSQRHWHPELRRGFPRTGHPRSDRSATRRRSSRINRRDHSG